MATPREPKKPSPSAPNKAFVRKDPSAWKRAGWTSAPNSIIHDEDLPPIEAWAWLWMASHTETFEINAQKLWKANKHVSKQAAYDLMHNLEVRGLLRRVHEVSDQGVPFIVYDLQPTPVPEEQRTAKPRKPKAKKKPPKGAFDWKSKEVQADSRPVGNPGTTRQNADQPPTVESEGGFPTGRESGDDQAKRGPAANDEAQAAGGVSPARVSPARAGESYKEYKTNKQDQPTTVSTQASDGSGASGALDGWSTSSEEQPPVGSPGSRFLSQLTFDDGTGIGVHAVRKYADHVDMLLISGWTEAGITERITDTTGMKTPPKNWAGFALRKLDALRPKPATPATTVRANVIPPWCRECDEDTRNTRDGRKCRTCHPRYAATNA